MNEEPVRYAEESDVPPSGEPKVFKWLIISYILIHFWGLWIFFWYWDGSHGWLDRGYWQELQNAARTTFSSTKESNSK